MGVGVFFFNLYISLSVGVRSVFLINLHLIECVCVEHFFFYLYLFY